MKNSLHLDVHVDGGRHEPWEIRWARVTAAVTRLTDAGATVIREEELQELEPLRPVRVAPRDGTPGHVVMADPEGNEFCVL